MNIEKFVQKENVDVDRPIVIMGGGVNLPNDLVKVKNRIPYVHKHKAYLMAVNWHGLILQPDITVSIDKDHIKMLKEEYKGLYGFLASTAKGADISLKDCPSTVFSGHAAVWLADYIGFKNIVLCGFDCYQSNRGHWHSYPEYPPRQHNHTEERAVQEWNGVKETLLDPSAISVVSGVLQEVFQPWA
jgi:hypothetical protein